MLTIYVIGMSVDHADAPLLLLAVPLALASIAYGLRGGIGMGILTSLVVAAWWVAERQYGGVAWLSSRAITCLFIGTVLGWFAESRQQLTRAIAHHRELSLDLIATANFDGYFTEVNPAFTRTLGFTSEELLSRPFTDFVHADDLVQRSPRLSSRPRRGATSSTSRTATGRKMGRTGGSSGRRVPIPRAAR